MPVKNGISCRVRGGLTAPKGAVRMSLQGATPSVPVPVTIITRPSQQQVCFTKPCALAATVPFLVVDMAVQPWAW